MKKIIIIAFVFSLLLVGATYFSNVRENELDSVINENNEEDDQRDYEERPLQKEGSDDSANNVEKNKKVEVKTIPQGKEDNDLSNEGESKNIASNNKVNEVINNTSTEKKNREEDNDLEEKNNINVKSNEEVKIVNKEDSKKDVLVISEDTIDNVESSLSLADKAKAIKLIVTKLTASDIKLLKDMVSGGLTKEEQRKAVEIAYSKYTEEELKLVKSLYKKYMGN